MITTETDLLHFLDALGVAYTRFEHPPVFTCEEAARLRPALAGVETKNLFLCDEKQNFYLMMTACEKRLDLKRLARDLGISRLKFGTQEHLLAVLGLTPGAVTVLALVNDPAGRVTLLVDADYWPSPAYLCHPLVNSATLVVTHESLLNFLTISGHPPQIVTLPMLIKS